MKYALVLTAIVTIASKVAAVGVVGKPEGFAAGATGGGNAAPVYPTTNEELVSYLGDSEARVIVLSKTEGSTTTGGCLPFGTAPNCQVAINKDNWCHNYEPNAATTTVTYKNAGMLGINIGSNKSLIGEGTSGVIKGRGLRLANGVQNIIVQNIAVTDINARYVWGGDAITLDQADLVWLDHITTARIGRQHYVLGTGADNRVSITNNFINGESEYSATCNGHHYWNVYLDGSSDKVTFQGNYLYKTSGRAPKVKDNTYLHAVNNYWDDNSGHAFEIGAGGHVLAEGNYFSNVNATLELDTFFGSLYASDSNSAACQASIGRPCVANVNGGELVSSSAAVLSSFKGEKLPSSAVANTNPAGSAGQGNL
uniref:pectin lyase n=1 Tax=Penicillium digitatum TaxID=36651 RepID=J9WQK2_PENDI|nr:PL1 [Penicillium digitatum]